MSADPDASAVRAVLAGDVQAFEGIVARWQTPLVSLAWRFTRDRDRAEDLAQLAFLRAFRSLDRWRGEAPLGSWLVALAANVYRSELRRSPPREVALTSEPPAGEDAPAEDPRAARVRRAVAALPAAYRDVLVLYYFQGRDVRATAAALDLAEGTVKARLARGRALVAAGLRPRRPDHPLTPLPGISSGALAETAP